MKASDLLYGKRKQGPGPKPIDAQAHYEERLITKIKARVGAFKDFEIDSPTVSGDEIIISGFHGEEGIHLIVESWGELREMPNATFPLFGTVFAFDLDDEEGRHLVDDHVSGVVEGHSDGRIIIEGVPGPYDKMGRLVMEKIICPVFQELAK